MHLVAGGAGFLGKKLTEKLVSAGQSVRVIDVCENPKIKSAEYLRVDVTNYKEVERAVKGCDVLYNLVSLLPCARAGKEYLHVNVAGTENLMRAANKYRVKKIIHVSSSIVYGIPKSDLITEGDKTKPIGDYGKSKLMAEEVCRRYIKKGENVSILRPRFIVGPGRLGLLTILFGWIADGKNIYSIGSGENKFQMIGANDLVSACMLAEKSGRSGVYNIGADNVPTVRELLCALTKHAKTGSKVRGINATLAVGALRILDFLKISPLGTEHYLIADKNYVLDTHKAKSDLGWAPKEDQIEAMIESYDWYIKNRGHINMKSKSNFPREIALKVVKFFS
jgi:nucleoside-diphosphate-sugar epimerase